MWQTEIERKFLVLNDGWKGRAQGVAYRQGYVARTQNRTVRIRIAGGKGVLNIKFRGEGIARSEFEYPVPLEEAEAMLASISPAEIIEKTRYTFEDCGSRWEVDEFHGANEGLVVAEIELGSERQEFKRPAWLGREISHVSRYFNAELSRQPYSRWSEEEKGNAGA